MNDSDCDSSQTLSGESEKSYLSDEANEDTVKLPKVQNPKRICLSNENNFNNSETSMKVEEPEFSPKTDDPETSPRTEENLRIFTFENPPEEISSTKNEKKHFVCTFCRYKTAHYSNLYVHMRTHTGEKPYYCGACGHRASQGSTLKTHIKSRHDGNIDEYYNLDCDLRVKLKPISEKNTEIIIAPIINDEIIKNENQLSKMKEVDNSAKGEQHPASTPYRTTTPKRSQPSATMHPGIHPTMPIMPGVTDPTMANTFYFLYCLMAQINNQANMSFPQNYQPTNDRQFVMRQAYQYQSYQHLYETFNALMRNPDNTSEQAGVNKCDCSERLAEVRVRIQASIRRMEELTPTDPDVFDKIFEIIQEMNNFLRQI